MFDTTSYWIYQNEQNLTYDTVRVSSVIEKVRHVYGGSSGGNHSYSYNNQYYSSNVQGNFSDIFYASFITRNNFIFPQIYSEQMFSDTSRVFFPKLDSIYYSHNINGLSFKDVKKLRTELQKNHTLYFADYVGIIRREAMINNQTEIWNLKEYNVKMFDRSN